MNKTGLSNIVAVVLVILLVLAAVAIVWGFIQPALKESGERTNLRSMCIGVDVQPVSCIYKNIVIDNSLIELTVEAKLKKGEIGGGILTAVTGKDETTKYSETLPSPTLLGNRLFRTNITVIPGDYEVLDEATVSGIVSDETGTETCVGSTIGCVYIESCTGRAGYCQYCSPQECVDTNYCVPSGPDCNDP